MWGKRIAPQQNKLLPFLLGSLLKLAVADPGEGPGGLGPLLFFFRPAPTSLISGLDDHAPPPYLKV